jgi:hypothetical protein
MYAQFGIKGHNGLDWPCPEGTELYASHDGRVTQVSTDEKAGMGVVILGTLWYDYDTETKRIIGVSSNQT